MIHYCFFDSMEGKEKEKEKQRRSVNMVGMAVIGRVSNVFESDDGKKDGGCGPHMAAIVSRGFFLMVWELAEREVQRFVTRDEPARVAAWIYV